jgi:hypothetical protein
MGGRAHLRRQGELRNWKLKWSVLDKAFPPDELIELLLTAGFWRMASGFLKSAEIPLDAGVPSWPEGKAPDLVQLHYL